jgi:hypothetical protein
MTLKTLLLVGSMAALAGAAAPVAISPALADGYPACRCQPAKPVVKRKVVKRRPAPVKIVYVDRPVDRVVEKIVERRVEVPVDRIVEKIVERPVERVVEKPVYVDRPVDRIVEKVVERRVEVPVERVVEKIVKVPVDRPVDRIVEKVVERRVEVPVDRVVEKIVKVPVDRVVERPVYVDRVIDRPVYIERPAPMPVPVRERHHVYFEPARPLPAHDCDCDVRGHAAGAYGSSQILFDSHEVSESASYESRYSDYGYESGGRYGDASYGHESGGSHYGSNARYGVGGGWRPQGMMSMPYPDMPQGHDGHHGQLPGEAYGEGTRVISRSASSSTGPSDGHSRPRRPDRYGQ